MVDWMKVLSEVIVVVLGVIAIPLGTMIGFYLKKLIDKTGAEIAAISPDTFDLLQKFAVAAVQAAEQSGLLTAGKEKKAFAIEQVEKWLDQFGIDIDLDLVDAAIEAAVFSELNWNTPAEITE
jgi:LL-H family phage holin